MNVRAIPALIHAAWRTAISYRVGFVVSLVSVAFTAVPVFFISRALQPMMAPSIQGEGDQYFAFLLVGLFATYIVSSCVEALPGVVSGDIANGFLEAVLGTPAGTPAVMLGLFGYKFLWSLARGVLLLLLGWSMGAQLLWAQVPAAALILALIVMAHFAIGLIVTALVIAFRTTGGIPQAVLLASGLLGGVYWPTTAIPSWIQSISAVIPLTYGLRALRRVFLDGQSLSRVTDDLTMLILLAVFLGATGVLALRASLLYARRMGSLAQY